MKGWFLCPTCGRVVGTRGRGPILCKDGHKGERLMDFVGEGEEGKIKTWNQSLDMLINLSTSTTQE